MTRARHLFDLASLCSVPPDRVDGLALTDFARLLSGIHAYRAAAARNEKG